MTDSTIQAVVIGATGLVGAEIIAQLLAHKPEVAVTSYARRRVPDGGKNWTQIVAPFADLAQHWKQLGGTVAFSALGTTKKQAGSLEAQYEVDYTYQLEFAKAARAQGVARFVLISAASASATSSFAYLKMKGELERDIAAVVFAVYAFPVRSSLDCVREGDCILHHGPTWSTYFLQETYSFPTRELLPATVTADMDGDTSLRIGTATRAYPFLTTEFRTESSRRSILNQINTFIADTSLPELHLYSESHLNLLAPLSLVTIVIGLAFLNALMQHEEITWTKGRGSILITRVNMRGKRQREMNLDTVIQLGVAITKDSEGKSFQLIAERRGGEEDVVASFDYRSQACRDLARRLSRDFGIPFQERINKN